MGKRQADFRRTYKVRFGDTDPAGVMYFPRFLDVFHEVFEDWFDDDLRMPYRWVLEDTRIGFPAVHTECTYKKPFRFGQTIEVELSVVRVGNKSFACRYRARLAGETEVRVDARVVTAVVNLDSFVAVPIPAPLRKALLDRAVPRLRQVPVGHISAAGE
jgi:4-hydroxybenzoyl-CoA thioesterase